MSEKTILLVEDNASDAELAERALKKAGIHNEVVVAADGQEALDYLFGMGGHEGRDTSDLPAVTLLDVKLPKVSGFDVLRTIRAESCTQRLPVVMLSSSAEAQDVAVGYDLGANSYLRKPIDYQEFVQMIGDVGWYWLGLNERPPRRC